MSALCYLGGICMASVKESYYEKRGKLLVNNLHGRHFDAYYCADSKEALQKALELIPAGASVGWGGAMSAVEIGLLDAVRRGNYVAVDRDLAVTKEEKNNKYMECFHTDVFLTGANAMSLDGQMVNIDGTGNRVAAIIYGPKTVLVIVGMNKVCDSLDLAMERARKIASPMNMQRFSKDTPCAVTGVCSDCKSNDCICNQIVITRHCRPAGRIKFLIVGEDLGY